MNRIILPSVDKDAVARVLRKMRLLRSADGVHFLFEHLTEGLPGYLQQDVWIARKAGAVS